MILTGQFFKLDDYKKQSWVQRRNLQVIGFSVSNSVPRGYEHRVEKIDELVPNWRWVKEYRSACMQSVDIRENVLRHYEKAYKRYLMTLDCKELVQRIEAEIDGGIAVLLCWEKSDFPCHRHWIKQWLKYNGIGCSEWLFKGESAYC